MAEQFNINNLTLDDNSFEVLPDGDYRFTVDNHSTETSTSDKIPPNTPAVVCVLKIPFYKEGVLKFATIKNTLNIYSRALFAVRQFTDCIGLTPEKGRVAGLDLDQMDGREGICALTTIESKNGNEFNRVQVFYAPSKAPLKTANDEAWAKRDDFTEGGEENPFEL